MLGQQPRDLDLEISGLPPGQLHALLSERFPVQFIGKAFGLFKLQGLPIEISIPSRILTDHISVPGLLSQSDPNTDLDESLARRDFTINAMAWDPDTLELRDPFNGRADLDAMFCVTFPIDLAKIPCVCCAACNSPLDLD